jgi:hypothetical protein
VTESLDHLDIELRCLPGVVSVGIADSGEALVLQVVVQAELAHREIRNQIRRLVRANVERPMVLEVLIEGRFPDNGNATDVQAG